MDILTMKQFTEVMNTRSDWCVSLFMPTHRAGPDTEQNPIRFKNLLQEAEKRLTAKGLRSPEIEEILEEPRKLLHGIAFWQHQSDGLAAFISKDTFRLFRLPLEFSEMVVVTDRFHVKPLLPVLTRGGTFHILAISRNQVRLLEGTRHTVDEIDLDDTPESLLDSFPEDWPRQQLHFHRGTPSGGGSRSAKSHGHDTGSDIKQRTRKWFRTIEKTVTGLLADTRSPLVLAGVDTLFPIYHEVNTYPHLTDQGVPGNPDEMTPEELHPKAWAIVKPIFNQDQKESAAQYRQLAGTGRTTNDVTTAVRAAHHGSIATLFVAVGVQVWGQYDPEQGTVEIHDTPQHGDEDLLDYIAIQTLTKGGTVFAVSPQDIPENAAPTEPIAPATLAAVLRH